MTNSPDEASPLRLIGFGSPRLEITTNGITHSIGPGKPLALVTFLAFAPRRTATRETLCDILWGDRPVELCRPALRQTLWLVKTQIDSTLLTSGPDGISLARNVLSDVDQFVEAVEANNLDCAVQLYAGDFFSGYAAPGARRFEEWASLERTRFQALFVQATESLARRAIDTGRFADAVQLARRLRSADPNGQVGWRLQLEARIASGDLIDARADADHFEEWLRKEEWDADPASRSILKLAREASPGRESDLDSEVLVSELVGREREFAAINDAWNEAQTRGARIVYIVAESGHGKTRLTRDVLSRIRVSRGAVHYVKANYGEREIPYSFAAAIAEAIASSPGAGGVAPAAADTLVSLNPALSASYSQSSRMPEQLEPLRVGLALLDLLTAVAEEEPLAIALD
ncbi:MAG: AAA family ATPase, partial [Gemmatimonadaceae bacterium]